MRTFWIICLLTLLPGTLLAQNSRFDRPWTVELGLGYIYAPNRLFFDSSEPGLSAYTEVNYNFKMIPLSVGAHLEGDVFNRVIKSENGRAYHPLDYDGMLYTSLRLMVVSDYHWLVRRQYSLFAGLGVGGAYCSNTKDLKRTGYRSYSSSGDGTEYPLSAQVRVGGIFLRRHMRVSLSYTYGDVANSFIGLHVGYIF